jgi:hypothetical protein
MSQQTRVGLIVAATAVVLPSAHANSQESPSPITKVDHFYAQSPRAQQLYEFLHGELQLPVVWPFSDYGHFASGGLSLGNVVFEVVKWTGTSGDASGNAALQGVAFESAGSASSTAAWLDEQPIGHTPLDPFTMMVDGSEQVFWVTFGLEVPPNNATIFVCDYKDRELVGQSQQTASQELMRSGGGPLGILALREIVLAVTDLQQASSSWIDLLGSERLVSPGRFQFSEGPAVRFTESSNEGFRKIVLEVGSLPEARAYLESKGILGAVTDDGLTILPEAIQGLTISLMQIDPVER